MWASGVQYHAVRIIVSLLDSSTRSNTACFRFFPPLRCRHPYLVPVTGVPACLSAHLSDTAEYVGDERTDNVAEEERPRPDYVRLL